MFFIGTVSVDLNIAHTTVQGINVYSPVALMEQKPIEMLGY